MRMPYMSELPSKILYASFGVIAAVFLVGGMASVTFRPANATPAYAAQTKLPCGRCHVNPAGDGANTPFEKAFAASGHKLPSKK